MKLKNKFILSISLLIGIFFFGCTEEIELKTQDFEDILVINANITSEEKQQVVNLSRTFEAGFAEVKESGATVIVTDDAGNTFEFRESSIQGNYLSDIPFAVQLDRTYSLSVVTSDGNTYKSDTVKPINTAFLENVRAELAVDDNGIEGVAIRVDSFDPEGKANYFRYEFEETYLIESFINSRRDLNIVSVSPPLVEIVPKDREELICYNTLFSNDILISSSDQSTDRRVTNFQIKFIPRDDIKVRKRYSILVHQFTQSRQAQAFYQSLKDFSSNENLFQQTQPGFIIGNITPENENEKVIGFFEVSMVSSKRIFFNFRDIFTDGLSSRFTLNCTLEEFNSSELNRLISRLSSGAFVFSSYDETIDTWYLVRTPCVDCTVLGTNVKPDFWID